MTGMAVATVAAVEKVAARTVRAVLETVGGEKALLET
ncbi:hypothetical protein Ctob_010573, partial [Chrysochromulina tobinii]